MSKLNDIFIIESKDSRTKQELESELSYFHDLYDNINNLKNNSRRGTSERERYAGALRNMKKKIKRLETLLSRMSESKIKKKKLINEGGVAGHLMHLYENWDLTFHDIMEVFRQSAEGELEEVTEKVDGMNLFISWSMTDGVLKAARNTTHIKQGGLDAEGLANKFAGRGAVHDAFVNAFNVLEKAINGFSAVDKQQIFGNDADVWYSIEVMFTDAPNTIVYDKNNVVFHKSGSARFNKETGKPTDDDISQSFELLSSRVKELQDSLNEKSWNIVMPAFIRLKKLASDKYLNDAVVRLNSLMSEYGIVNSDTLGLYIKTRLHIDVVGDLQIDRQTKEHVVQKIMGEKGSKNINEILKSIEDDSTKKQIKQMVENSKQYLDECVAPVEEIIREFSVEILRGLKSAFIIDNDKEVQRLRKEISTAIDAIASCGYEEAMDILTKQMKRIKNIETISSPMEGIVFKFKGHTYKYTGTFAPVNQVLGLFKFGRGKVPPLNVVLNSANAS